MQEEYMKIAIKEAKKAASKDEVPIGTVIVKDNKILAKAHNMVEKTKDATMHAEIIAIKKASKKIKNWRLNNCEMYVTLEPCNMCMNAIELSRIEKIYYLIPKTKNINIKSEKYIHIKNKNESLKLLQTFFKNKR